MNATYSAGGYLEAGTYDVIINNSGKDLIRQANSDFLLDDSEFIKGTLTVNPVVLTVTPDAYEKVLFGTRPPKYGWHDYNRRWGF